jgi:hypothetical protein
LVFAVLAAALTMLAPRLSLAGPSEEDLIQPIKDHAAECQWILDGRTVAGGDLAKSACTLKISGVRWEDNQLHFLITIEAPQSYDGQSFIYGRWTYRGTWACIMEGEANSPTWRVTEEPGTIHPRSSSYRIQPHISHIIHLPF